MHIGSSVVAALAVALAVSLVSPGSIAGASSEVETFVAFDPAAAEFPEGVALDKTGNVYVSLSALNQIRRIDPGGTQSVVTEFDVSGLGPAGMAVDPSGAIFVAVAALDLASSQSDPATRGVYRVGEDGTNERLPGTGEMLFANDVTLDKRGNVYATDTGGGAVWRVRRGGVAELWAKDPLLAGDGSVGFGFPIGANGIAFRHNTLLVANTERGLLVEIPILPDGSAGAPTLLAESPALRGADGIALDVHGDMYVAVSLQNTVLRVGRDGSIATLATAADGLNQPSTLAFGTGRGDRKTLYVANFSIFSPAPTPGVLKLRVGVPGQPEP